MRALIYEQAGSLGAGALDVAGRPLLVRQLQWLRDQGIEDVVVEVAIGIGAVERGQLLLGSDPLSARCLVIPTRCAIGVGPLAARAGLADDELFLALPADILVHAHLTPPTQAVVWSLPAPPFAAQQGAVALVVRTRQHEPSAADTGEQPPPTTSSWAVRVVDLASAHAVSCAALAGLAPALVVHAAEVRPGIWLARGARVSEDATLIAPLLVGPEARVLAKARVGPNVVLGHHALIERDVVLSEAVVAAGTLVGEGMRARHAQLDARGITSLPDHARTDVDAPLQLSSTLARGPLVSSRLVALLLLLLLVLPWTLGFSLTALLGRRIVRRLPWRGRVLHVGTMGFALLDVVPALLDVVLGRRDLVGVASRRVLELEGGRVEGPLRGGALDISAALAPAASTSTLLWMWRWYLQNKSARLDARLWWRARIAARSEKSTTRAP